MRERSDPEQRVYTQAIRRGRPRRAANPLFVNPRTLLLVALALAAVVVALVSRSAPPSAGFAASRTGGSSAVAPRAGSEPLVPAVRPTPTPAAIRPLTAPTAVPVMATGAAPVRRPEAPDPNPSTDHVIVMDGDSGVILFQRNAHEPIPMASLTKIMTAILGIEYGNLSDHPRIDVNARDLSDSTLMGLEPWFDVSFQDLLYGLMLPSGNDAALAIGRYVSGSDKAFVTLMNQKATRMGLRSTHFANAHGLDAPNHYSSPYDMAMLARYGMQYPTFRKLAAAKKYAVVGSNVSYTIYNLNPIIGAYPGADGVKIGYTENAGRAMVATAVRDGHRVYVAFMKSEAGLAPDTTELLDWAFNSHIWPENGGGSVQP
ncbi:MAG: D-alanyl-D-alanine carboxypeptidase family protein [Chloroflexota bacterium]